LLLLMSFLLMSFSLLLLSSSLLLYRLLCIDEFSLTSWIN
jgi:hypothetical protein